jgi:hypothetical protein
MTNSRVPHPSRHYAKGGMYAEKAPSSGRCLNPQKLAASYTLKLDPHPQVLFTAAFSNLNPAASSVST